MPRSRFARHRHLILAVVTALLLGLLASMALAATSHRSSHHGGYGGGGGYGYGYGGYGYGGYGYGGYGYGGYGYGYGYGYGSGCSIANDCPNAQYFMTGRVIDSARYADALAHGVPAYRAQADAAVAGASVTLQRSMSGGPWVTLPASSVGGRNPVVSNEYGNFAFYARGIGRVRAVATMPGYETGYSAAYVANGRFALDVFLTAAQQPGGGTTTGGDGSTTTTTRTETTNNGDGRTATTATVPTVPARPITPGRPAPVRAAGCATRRGSAKAACERAARLATALRSCTKAYKKGSKRTLCERRARALSSCDARTGRKRSTCRAKALQIGKTTKKHKAASRHAAHH